MQRDLGCIGPEPNPGLGEQGSHLLPRCGAFPVPLPRCPTLPGFKLLYLRFELWLGFAESSDKPVHFCHLICLTNAFHFSITLIAVIRENCSELALGLRGSSDSSFSEGTSMPSSTSPKSPVPHCLHHIQTTPALRDGRLQLPPLP